MGARIPASRDHATTPAASPLDGIARRALPLAALLLAAVVAAGCGGPEVFHGPYVVNYTSTALDLYLADNGRTTPLDVTAVPDASTGLGSFGDGCSHGTLLAKDTAGTVVARRDAPLCDGDGWIIAEPVDIVEVALGRIARHDPLEHSLLLVCTERRDLRAQTLPVSLSGIFAPVQAMPDFNVPRTLSVIDLDTSRLRVAEQGRSQDGTSAEVAIDGLLVERFDPAEVEALFRAYANEMGQQVDQVLLDETLANVSAGLVDIEIQETVELVQQDGMWRICPPLATP